MTYRDLRTGTSDLHSCVWANNQEWTAIRRAQMPDK